MKVKRWHKDYETKSKSVHAARLRKSNTKEIIKAINARYDTVQGSVQLEVGGISWKQQHIIDVEYFLRFGDWLVMDGSVKVVTPRDFTLHYEERHYMPSHYTPTENEVKIIRCLTSDEYYYAYQWICDETDLTREQAKEAIDKLRLIGVVQFARGLMNEDGEVGGSGFGIKSETRAEALLYRYYLNKGEAPE